MSAYNFVMIEATCPSCGVPSPVQCQVHIASAYGGDETGRFHGRTYRLGERMAWWPDRGDWTETHPCIQVGATPGTYEEGCYSTCSNCRADLCVVLRFRDVTPLDVVGVWREIDWPGEYPK